VDFARAKEGQAVIIDQLPWSVKGFFLPLRSNLSKPQYAHLWTLTLALLINLRAAKLIHLARVTPCSTHRTRHGSFLSHADVDVAALLEERSSAALAQLKPKAGETIYLLLDDHRIAKRGSKMARLSKIWDHKSGTFVHGHIVLFAAILFRGVVLPWRLTLQKPKGQTGPRYRKLTDLAARMIQDFVPPPGVKVRVLFDAFYLSPRVTRACHDRGFSYFSVAARNRKFRVQGAHRRHRKIGRLASGLLRHNGRNVRMKRSRGQARLRIAGVEGHLSHIGDVIMVLSKRPFDRWKRVTAIVSNETNLAARMIVSIYERRWMIEVLFKELEVDLGLGDYQMQREEGILKHLHLCCLAHLALTHHSMKSVGVQAKKKDETVDLPTMSQRLEQLRSDIRHEQMQKLFRCAQEDDPVRQKVEQYLQAA